MTTIAIKIPATFYFDHVNRDLSKGTVLKEYANGKVLVEMNDEEIGDLLSDAEYYAGGVDYAELKGLQSSAKATVRAINDQVEWAAK
jgi:hypothetical protein